MKYCVLVFVHILFVFTCPISAMCKDIPTHDQRQVWPVVTGPPVSMEIPSVSAETTKVPPIKMVEPGVFDIGGVRILKKLGRVEFPAMVNMNTGLLEYLIVGEGGKVHESLLRTSVEPYCLQIALLMLGLEGTTLSPGEQGYARRPEGDNVQIMVRMKNHPAGVDTFIEEWFINKAKNESLKPMAWVFTGSFVSNGIFMAQVEKSIAAVYRDPVAMIDNPLPDGVSDEIWFANEEKTPAPGTEVTVIIKKIIKNMN